VTKTDTPEHVVLGETRPVGARFHLAGRHNIRMTEWGPHDHEEPLLWRGAGDDARHRYYLLGAAIESATVSDGARLIRNGNEIDVRSVEGGIVSYELIVTHEGGQEAASGVLVDARWDLLAFGWTVDPRADAAAWRAEGAARETPWMKTFTDGLRLHFGSGGHDEIPQETSTTALPVDRFGTIATTALRFPAGSWRIRTVSDDGIRVWVDGEVVIDDWTHHGATVHEATIGVEEEREVALRVEHFELDGAAILVLEILAD
jgi:hypothetical protein